MSPLTVIQDSQSKPHSLSIKSIIAVGAGKGGVGKSTVSVNLALALREKGLKVGLLDADIYGPSLKQMLPEGIEPVNNPDDVERLLPAMTFGMPFISVAHFQKEASIVRAPIASQIIDQFLHLIDWGELDYLVIDFPPGTGDIQLSLMQKAPLRAALVVTTPQAVATADVRKAMQLFQKLHVPLLGVVENMSFLELEGRRLTPFGKGGAEQLAREFAVPLLGRLPIDPLLSQVADAGESLFATSGATAVQQVFTDLAQRVELGVEQLPAADVQVRQGAKGYLEFLIDKKWSPLELRTIQQACPCARCEGRRKVQKEVALLEFSPIGRYAVRIQFSSGCSRGIYPFSLIRRLLQI